MSPLVLFVLKTVLVIVVILLISAAWIWWKLRSLSARLWAEHAETMANGGYAPPMRLDLESVDRVIWSDIDKIYLIEDTLLEAGYEPAGLFEAAAPFRTYFQGFQNRQLPGYAVLSEVVHTQEIYLELFSEMSDGAQIRVTNAPDDGLDYPEFCNLIRMDDFDLTEPEQIQSMHRRLETEIQGKTTTEQSELRFEQIFKQFWSRTMDWRMERGGITTEEVIQVFEINGQPNPSDGSIELAKQPWKKQIDLFITDLVRQSYLSSINLPENQRAETLDRLVIVHEKSVPARLIEILVDTLNYNDQLESGADRESELNTIFDSQTSVIEGFRQAIEILPPEKKFVLQSSIEIPLKSDIYLSPKYYN
ncbi:MAG: hypothetical protein KDA70_09765 [Planctomycetaceae bacterium]|nr:hypothetical protein [Planctomycetaceae bacterium]